MRAHPDPSCRQRIAATCAAAIECEHGYDCCPICDPCTCRPRYLLICTHEDHNDPKGCGNPDCWKSRQPNKKPTS